MTLIGVISFVPAKDGTTIYCFFFFDENHPVVLYKYLIYYNIPSKNTTMRPAALVSLLYWPDDGLKQAETCCYSPCTVILTLLCFLTEYCNKLNTQFIGCPAHNVVTTPTMLPQHLSGMGQLLKLP
jgi:hypothetical protein